MADNRRPNEVRIHLSDKEIARLDELRGAQNRSAFFRRLLKEPPNGSGVASHERSLEILTIQAEDGSSTAAVALEKALREIHYPQRRPKKAEDELERLVVR